MTENSALRRAVIVVALANLAYFFVEMGVALRIGSVSLLADGADFFEDAAVNTLIAVALSWTAARRARVGKLLAFVLLVPALAFVWTLWRKLGDPTPPAPRAWGRPVSAPWPSTSAAPSCWPGTGNTVAA